MPANDVEMRRLSDLLGAPRETLDIEIKEWLDTTNEDKATKANKRAKIAKGCIALANHGGGYFVLGFMEQSDGSFLPDRNRPDELQKYNQDAINGIIARYAEPEFHCAVQYVEQGGLTYPVVIVPGGHKVPIRAKVDSPDGKLKQYTYYIRRPGPKSEPPQNGAEWDELMRRCLRNSRDELLDAMRDVLSGRASTIPSTPSDVEQLEEWTNSSVERWQQVIAKLPEESPARFLHGYYAISYAILGEKQTPNLIQFQKILYESVVRYSGWPPFLVFTKEGIEPYPRNDTIECWIRPDYAMSAPHSDFWRASPEGQMFLVRGYDEDDYSNPAPGTAFDISMHTRSVGECLLHAESLARNLKAETASVLFQIVYTGLDGRRLVSIGNRNRAIYNNYVSRQDVYERSVQIEVENISSNLIEIVYELLAPLYALFGFFELPLILVQEELAKLRSRR